MFETLNERLEKIVNTIRGKAVISESDLDTTMREIRISLLEADVALSVVKSFVDNINCLLYTSPSPRDGLLSRMPSSA